MSRAPADATRPFRHAACAVFVLACVAGPACVTAPASAASDSASASAATDSTVTPASRDSTLLPGVRDTVTVLPPVHVDDARAREIVPDRTTATRARLERSDVLRFMPATAADALTAIPGVEVVKTGPWASRVSLRGLSGDRVVVMVDGARLNTVRGHGVQSSLVALDRLDAIEVLPGAGSTQFGSDALGGVVNLVTHRSLFADRPGASVTLTSRGTEPGDAFDQQVRGRFQSRAFGFEAGGGYGRLGALVIPAGRVRNSGDHEDDLTLRFAARLAGATLDAEHSAHAARDIGLPAFNTASGSAGEYPLQSRVAQRVELSVPGAGRLPEARVLAVVQALRTHFTETTVDTVYRLQRPWVLTTNVAADRVLTRSLDLQPTLAFHGPGSLRLFGGYRREWTTGPRVTDMTGRFAATGTVGSQQTVVGESMPNAWRSAWSGAAYASGRALGVRLESGVRYDMLVSHADSTAHSATSRLDVTDRKWSAEGGLSHVFGPVEGYAHLASGFRAPNLEERYYDDDIHGGLRLFGNPDLVPERSLSYEAGVRGTDLWGGRLGGVRVSVYRSDVEDMITFRYFDQLYGVPRFRYLNIHRARLDGVEAQLDSRLGPVRVALEGGLPRGRDLDSGDRLADIGVPRASIEGRVGIPRLLPLGQFAVRARWNDAVRNADSTLARPSFWVTSAELSCSVAHTRAVLAVRNLANATFREPLSFIFEPGRTYTLSLRRDIDVPLPFARSTP